LTTLFLEYDVGTGRRKHPSSHFGVILQDGRHICDATLFTKEGKWQKTPYIHQKSINTTSYINIVAHLLFWFAYIYNIYQKYFYVLTFSAVLCQSISKSKRTEYPDESLSIPLNETSYFLKE